MNTDELEQLLTDFTNAVRVDKTPSYGELLERDWYVRGLHGQRDAIRILKRNILRLEGGGVFLFTGQIGSGKTTELTRLQYELKKDHSTAVKAYYCDLADWLNLNEPINLGSFLVALLAAWVSQLGTATPQHSQRTPFERLRDFLTNTQLLPKDFGIEADVAGLKAKLGLALQTDTSFKEHVANVFLRQRTNIVQQAHLFVADLREDLCPKGEKCVLIADSLEKIRGYGTHSEAVYASLQQLFVSDGAALRLPGVHVVYSVSPFLIEQNNQLPTLLGTGDVVTMPSVHVFQQRSQDEDVDGVNAMLNLVKARFPRAFDVFTPEQLRRMAMQSGGDLRDFLRSITVALSDDIEQLPVADDVVNYALQRICPPKTIPNEHIAWLARLDASHEPELSKDINSLILQQYLTSKHILVYLNGQTWYAVHPLLRDWVKQRTAATAPASAT